MGLRHNVENHFEEARLVEKNSSIYRFGGVDERRKSTIIYQITRRRAGTGDDIVIDETSETTIKRRSATPTEFVIDENAQYPLKFRPAVPRGATL